MRKTESASQTAGPYVHIGLTPNFAEIKGVYQADLGAGPLAPSVEGQQIVIEGCIFDGAGDPVRDALVEIWQADHSGKYATANDPSGFLGWARRASDLQTGLFQFETIKPGAVTDDAGLHAPHVTFWIVARGINIGLQTRMYFPEDADLLAKDPVLSQVPEDRRKTLMLSQSRAGQYRTDIHLQGDLETVFFDL